MKEAEKAKKTSSQKKPVATKKAKKLVVFYSRTGITRKVANAIASALECELEELIDKTNRQGVKGYLAGGRDALKKSLTEIEAIKKNITDYEMIIIGTPVWAGMPAPAVRTFLSQNKDKIKKVAFFCTMGGSGNQKTIDELNKILGTQASQATATATALTVLTREVVKDLHIDKVKEFARQLMS